MKPSFLTILGILLVGATSFVPTPATAKTWTDVQGRTIEADLVGVTDNAVVVKLKGKDITIPFDKLSKEDVIYAKEQKKVLAHLELTTAKAPSRWPKQVKGPSSFRLKEEKTKGGSGKTYKTDHFRFVSDTELHEEAQEAVGKLYEGTWHAIRALPLPIPRVKRSNAIFDARLVPTMDAYYQNGGPQGSSGVFTSKHAVTGKRLTEKDIKDDKTLVPFPSMGISQDGKISGEMKSHTLAHEITHQLTCTIFANVTWINEGMAEYIGYTPYDGTVFDFDGTFKAIRQAGLMYNQDFNLPFSLENFLDMSQEKFYGQGLNYQNAAHKNYTLAAMLVSYFVHLDEKNGLDYFVDYMKELQKGGADVKKAQKKLLGKRSYQELEEDFCKAWAAKGVTVKFNASR